MPKKIINSSLDKSFDATIKKVKMKEENSYTNSNVEKFDFQNDKGFNIINTSINPGENGQFTLDDSSGNIITVSKEELNEFLKSMNLSDFYIEKIIAGELSIKDIYAENLLKSGFTEKDVDRILNNEITIKELYDEIMKDSNPDRLKNLLGVQYIFNIKNMLLNSDEESSKILLELLSNINNTKDLESFIKTSQTELDKLTNERNSIQNQIDNIKSHGSILANGALAGLSSEETEKIRELTEELNAFDRIYGDRIDELAITVSQLTSLSETIENDVYEQAELINPYQSKDDYEAKNEFIDKGGNPFEEIRKNFFDKASGGKSVIESDNTTASGVQGTITESEIQTVKIYNIEEEATALYYLLNGKVDNEGNKITYSDISYSIISDDRLFEHYAEWMNNNQNGDIITAEEIKVFNYIYNTEGAEKAIEYLDKLKDIVDQRNHQKMIMEDSKWAEENPFLSSVGSIFITPVEGINAALSSLDSIAREDKILRSDVYSKGDVWRSAVGEKIAKEYGGIAGFLYNTGMSLGDTALLIGANIATGGYISTILSPTLMGSRAYASSLNDALDRGLSDEKAVAFAFSSAIIESIFEEKSLGHLMNLEGALAKQSAKITSKVALLGNNEGATKAFYVLSGMIAQGICEGEEEFETEIANFILDDMISGDLSGYNLSINSYMNQGYSAEEAIRMASWDFAGRLGMAFLGGFISGNVYGGISSYSVANNISKSIASDIVSSYNGATAFAEGVEMEIIKNEAIDIFDKKIKEDMMTDVINKISERLQSITQKGEFSISDSAKSIAQTINTAYVNASLESSYLIPPYMHMFDNIIAKVSQFFNNLFGRNTSNNQNIQNDGVSFYAPKTVSYEDVASIMSKETFDYIKNLSKDSSNVICIKQVSDLDLKSIYSNGIKLNGHASSGMGAPIMEELTKQDEYAKKNGQQSYLDILVQNGVDLTSEYQIYSFLVDYYDIKTKKYSDVMADLRSFNSMSLKDSVYYDLYEDDLFDRISSAYGVSEGGNPVNGVVVLKIPKSIFSGSVDKNSSIVSVDESGFLSIKPEYIEGFIPVSSDGKVGQVIYKNKGDKIKTLFDTINSWGKENGADNYAQRIVDAIKKRGIEPYLNNIPKENNARAIINSMSVDEIVTAYDLYTGNKTQEVMKIVFDTINSWGKENGADNYAQRIVDAIKRRGIEPYLNNIPKENNARAIINSMSVDEIVAAYDSYVSGMIDLDSYFLNNDAKGSAHINRGSIAVQMITPSQSLGAIDNSELSVHSALLMKLSKEINGSEVLFDENSDFVRKVIYNGNFRYASDELNSVIFRMFHTEGHSYIVEHSPENLNQYQREQRFKFYDKIAKINEKLDDEHKIMVLYGYGIERVVDSEFVADISKNMKSNDIDSSSSEEQNHDMSDDNVSVSDTVEESKTAPVSIEPIEEAK